MNPQQVNQPLEGIELIKKEENIFTRAQLLYHFRTTSSLRANEIARQLGLAAPELSALLRLRHIPEILRDGYYAKIISHTHLYILSRLRTEKKMIEAYEEVLQQSLTTAQTEVLVREKLYDIKTEGKRLPKEELDQLKAKINHIDPSITITTVQTHIQAQIKLVFKGNLEKTSLVLRKIIDAL